MTTSEMKKKVDLIVKGMWDREMTFAEAELIKAEVMRALIDKVCDLEDRMKEQKNE